MVERRSRASTLVLKRAALRFACEAKQTNAHSNMPTLIFVVLKYGDGLYSGSGSGFSFFRTAASSLALRSSKRRYQEPWKRSAGESIKSWLVPKSVIDYQLCIFVSFESPELVSHSSWIGTL